MEGLINLVFFFVFIGMAYGVGTFIEAEHYSKIKKTEKDYLNIPAITSKDIEDVDKIANSQLVYGSVVISLDYFKRFLAGLRNIIGGRIGAYETLLDRGRREAILRMKEQAKEAGYDMVLNMRFETSSIGQVTQRRGSVGCFEVLAYGTAVKLKP